MERIVNFIAQTEYKNIPEEARQVAKNAIVDWVGVAIAGSGEPATRIAASYARRLKVMAEAGVIGGAFRTSTELAAWVNGAAGHALDYDDTFPSSAGYNFHPTVPVLPAVLALGQRYHSPGAVVIAAYVAGVEVESRLGAAVGRHSSEIGWHPTAVLGTIGAVAACANLLRLNHRQVRAALGIAGSLTGGLVRNFGTMTKPLHAGNAARNGVVAALLAREGFTANESIMEGENGFCRLFSGGKVTGLGDVDQDLGERWHIVSPGISFKAYPCCRSTHSSIDASFQLRNMPGLDPSQVAEIICKTSPWHTQLARFHRPKSGSEGKFSIPYCIAAALLRGKVSLEDFTDEKVADGEVQALLAKVEYLYPVEYRKSPSSLAQEVVVKLNNGAEYAYRVDLPKGEPANPLTDGELRAKFVDCAGLLLPQVVIERVLDMLTSLESLDDIFQLIDVLTVSR
jgi:2-methylcitrate dehydratase PrpD